MKTAVLEYEKSLRMLSDEADFELKELGTGKTWRDERNGVVKSTRKRRFGDITNKRIILERIRLLKVFFMRQIPHTH